MADEKKSMPETISYDYLKSNQFRVVHADGAYFALTTQGGLTISFFAERQPIPRRVVHKLNPDGNIGEEITDQRVVRDAVIRDAEVAVTMSLDTARRVREKLDEVFNLVEKMNPQKKEARK